MLLQNPRKFLTVINPADRSKIDLTSSNDEPIPDNECPSVLNDVFTSYFTKTSSNDLPGCCTNNYVPMYPVIINLDRIVKIIEGFKSFSGAGIDCINSNFLKSTKIYSSIIKSKAFQQSLENSIMPADWKIGKVIPVHKPRNKQSPHNYRPISITSIPCKILEHVLFAETVNFLESNSFLMRKHY